MVMVSERQQLGPILFVPKVFFKTSATAHHLEKIVKVAHQQVFAIR